MNLSRAKLNLLTVALAACVVGGAVGLYHWHRWSAHCLAEWDRCSKEAEEWERISKGLRIVADCRSRQAVERPAEAAWYGEQAKRELYLSGRADKIARLYRAEATRWRWGLAPQRTRDYQRELWREPE